MQEFCTFYTFSVTLKLLWINNLKQNLHEFSEPEKGSVVYSHICVCLFIVIWAPPEGKKTTQGFLASVSGRFFPSTKISVSSFKFTFYQFSLPRAKRMDRSCEVSAKALIGPTWITWASWTNHLAIEGSALIGQTGWSHRQSWNPDKVRSIWTSWTNGCPEKNLNLITRNNEGQRKQGMRPNFYTGCWHMTEWAWVKVPRW